MLTQAYADLCFDQENGAVRPRWESGPLATLPRTLGSTNNTQTPAVAIHGHIYYPELLPELLDAWHAIPRRHLLINTDCKAKAKIIRELCDRRGEENVDIRVMPNRGRDIASMLVGWREEICRHEIVVHCHTKRTPYARKGFGDQWRQSLIRSCFPGRDFCRLFQSTLRQRESGLIMPWPHSIVAHNANWGRNYSRITKLMGIMGHEVKRHTILQFPVGSFFWARVSALKPLFDLQLRWQDFAAEPLDNDGTLAHALERCFGLIPTATNCSNYAYWNGPICHDIGEGLNAKGLVPLPKQNQEGDAARELFHKEILRLTSRP